jgi:O-antigen/teichoic acid export membrane protein
MVLRRLATTVAAKRQLLLAFVASGANQVFGSATNLLIGIFLVRHMAPAEFGLYNIAFAVTITTAAIGNSVFLIPMTVSIPHDDPAVRDRFMLDYVATSAVCMAGLGLVAALAVATGMAAGWLGWHDAVFAYSTILACLGFYLKDAMVQGGYNQGRERATILINVASAGAVAVLIVTSTFSGRSFNAPVAILGYALSQFAALTVGYALVFARLPLPQFAAIGATAKKLIGNGFWPACSSALSLLRQQAHTVVVAGLIGPAGVAAVNASRLVFAPVQLAQPALVRAAMPRLVRALRVDRGAFRRGTLAITGALGAFSFVYSLTAVAAGPWIFPLIVGPRYGYVPLMLLAWGCYLTLVALRSGIELNQLALQRFKALAWINLPGALASVIGAVAFTQIAGPPGALFGLAAGEVVIILLLALKLRADS